MKKKKPSIDWLNKPSPLVMPLIKNLRHAWYFFFYFLFKDRWFVVRFRLFLFLNNHVTNSLLGQVTYHPRLIF